ncbi:MAG TPA: hypothetical protein DEA90_00355 [Opitutae bacterium]|nr:hypothetical protein [Opitutae bacterium]
MLRRYSCLISTVMASITLIPLAAEEAISPTQITEQESWNGSVFRIEDTKTRVSIASVNLSVSDLKPEDGNLVGEYTIQVPLMQSKNDKGKIVLPLEFSMDELGAKGGTLRGQAISYKEGTTPNLIICEIIPKKNQRVLLDITTDDRTLSFKSRYSIVESSNDS